VEKQLGNVDQIRARSLGALKVLEHMPGQSELRPMLEALRRARPPNDSG
jgi:hypothetical protein